VLPRRVVRFHDLARESGVRVEATAPDGAARGAGVLSGDVIVRFAGEPVGTVDELHRLLTEERVGKTAALTVLRRTERRDIEVTPREAPPRRSG
jgi:S1-C subfamily serine protease